MYNISICTKYEAQLMTAVTFVLRYAMYYTVCTLPVNVAHCLCHDYPFPDQTQEAGLSKLKCWSLSRKTLISQAILPILHISIDKQDYLRPYKNSFITQKALYGLFVSYLLDRKDYARCRALFFRISLIKKPTF